jgi:hypothetical protein
MGDGKRRRGGWATGLAFALPSPHSKGSMDRR